MTSHIRIPDISPVAQAAADGAKSVFSFPFPIFKASDLEVRANNTLVTSGYSVVGEGSSTGGAVIFTNAPANGVRVTLRRKQTYARTDDFLDERAPTPHELNDAVDQNVAAIQELAEQVSRSVKRPLSADLSQPVDLSLPLPEAGKVIGWNETAGGLVNIDQLSASNALLKAANLSDLPNKETARNNLELKSAALLDKSIDGTLIDNSDSLLPTQKAVKTYVDSAATGVSNNALLKTGNLGGLSDKAAARSNLDLKSAALLDKSIDGTLIDNSDSLLPTQKAVKTYVDSAATGVSSNALLKTGNLGGLSDKAAARGNLDLGTAATRNVGTAPNEVAAGDHTHAFEPVDANIVRKNVANTYTAQQTSAAQVLTDAATVNIAITSQVWTLTTTASRTIGAPTGGVANTFYFLKITTNGFTPTWSTAFDFGAANAPANLSGICGFDIFYDGSKYRISTRFTGGA